ncbi:transposase-like protein [Corynebacterium diphtheriae VA01]|nr:transposase-like protein [Corynebacterium diphtheriae VA01]
MNSKLRKATRNRVQFPSDSAAVKTLWLMICNIEDRRAARRILVNQSSYTNGLTPSRKPVIADIGEPLDG